MISNAMRLPTGLFSVLSLLIATIGPAQAQLIASPVLQLELGAHTDAIGQISTDAAGRFLVTPSNDKTVRVWRLADKRLDTTLRVPIGEGFDGKLYASAISPDGQVIAVAGWTKAGEAKGHSVYLFNRASGRLMHRVGGMGNAVLDLKFMPEHNAVAVAVAGVGLTIVDVTSGKAVARVDIPGTIHRLATRGRLVATSHNDRKMRLWALEKSPEPRLVPLGEQHTLGKTPFGIAFSPDGRFIALTYADSPELHLYTSSPLALSTEGPDTSVFARGDLSSVTWSADGSALFAGGRMRTLGADGKEYFALVSWARQGDRFSPPAAHPLTRETIYSLNALPGGRIAYASGARWGIHSRGGQEEGPIAVKQDLGSLGGARLRVDKRSDAVGTDEWVFDPAKRGPVDRGSTDLMGPRQGSERIVVEQWLTENALPRVNGVAVGLDRNERNHGIAIAEDDAFVVFASDWWLRQVDAAGKLVWKVPAPGNVRSVNLSRSKPYVVAAMGDGTIRWYRISDGQEVLALFAQPELDRWVMWTPEGYYDASPGGESLIGWHLNQGKDKEARFIPNSQLYDVFYRPDIVQAKFKGEDIAGLVTLTAEQALQAPPPEVVLTKVPGTSPSAREQLCYRITSTGGGIGEVRVFQNGKLVKSDGFYRDAVARREDQLKLAAVDSGSVTRSLRALKLKQADLPNLPAGNKGNVVEECQPIEPIAGDNDLGVVAFNAQNTVQSGMAAARFVSTRPPETPHLHILAIGIDQFADQSANLKFAGKDARDFLEIVRQKTGTLFKAGNIHTATLGNAQATKPGILREIDDLATRIKAGDTFILFVASHGVLLGNQYYLVSAGYDGTADLSNLVGSNEIVELSKKIRALNQLYVFDTCHAGGVDNLIGGLYDARMSVLAKKMGLHIYAAAGGLQEALDGYQGNGLFTHALINSLKEAAQTDTDRDGKVSVMELGKAAKDRTTAISTKIGHPQTPTMIHFGKDVAVAAR
jgi:WD40 repeat protein